MTENFVEIMATAPAAPIDTLRRYPRDLRQAFPHDFATSAIGIEGEPEPLRLTWLQRAFMWLFCG